MRTMTCRVFVVSLLTACLLGFGFGQPSGCPTTSQEVPSWINSVFGDCMRAAVRTLRLSKHNCSAVMNNTRDCIASAVDACRGDQDPDVVHTMENFMGMSLSKVDLYESILCDDIWSTLPTVGNIPAGQIEGCEDNYASEMGMCSNTYFEIFREDPLDERLCREYNNVVTCQVDNSRNLCTIFTAEQLRQSEQQLRDGNIYCDASAGTMKSPMLATMISLLYVVSMVWWK